MGVRRIVSAYLGPYESGDHGVGLILKELEARGELDNTIIVYSSDHGDYAGEHGLFEKNGGISTRAITRIPMIVRYPGRVPEGRVSDEIVEAVDVFPTLCELAGIDTPNTPHGRSFAPLLDDSPRVDSRGRSDRKPVAQGTGDEALALCGEPAWRGAGRTVRSRERSVGTRESHRRSGVRPMWRARWRGGFWIASHARENRSTRSTDSGTSRHTTATVASTSSDAAPRPHTGRRRLEHDRHEETAQRGSGDHRRSGIRRPGLTTATTSSRRPTSTAFIPTACALTDFHVGPTCAPTRAGLLTGHYCNCTGVWHTIMGRSLLRADEVTVAEVFRSSGYHTGMFGKWHLGDNHPFHPHERGFEEALYHGGGGPSARRPTGGATIISTIPIGATVCPRRSRAIAQMCGSARR